MAGKWRILAAEARICHGLAFCRFFCHGFFAHAGVGSNDWIFIYILHSLVAHQGPADIIKRLLEGVTS